MVAWTVLAFVAGAGSPAAAATIEHFDHASYLAAAGAQTVFTFEDRPLGTTVLSTDYNAQGLSIVHRQGSTLKILSETSLWGYDFTGNANSPQGVINASGVSGAFDDSISENVDLILLAPRVSAGVWIGNIGPSTATIEFLAADGTVLQSETLSMNSSGQTNPGSYSSRIFYGVSGDQEIERIRVHQGTDDYDAITFDDVQFSVATVPEPASLAVVAGAGLALASRRRRAAAR